MAATLRGVSVCSISRSKRAVRQCWIRLADRSWADPRARRQHQADKVLRFLAAASSSSAPPDSVDACWPICGQHWKLIERGFDARRQVRDIAPGNHRASSMLSLTTIPERYCGPLRHVADAGGEQLAAG